MQKNAKSESILEAFEYIVELAEDSNLDKDFFAKAAPHIKYAASKLQLSEIQVVLLSIFVDRSEDSHIMMSEIASYTGCRTTKILRLSDDIDALEAKCYLRVSRSRKSLSYRVPVAVLKALRKNQPYVYEKEAVPDTQTFFDRFDLLMNEKSDNEQTHATLIEQTTDMLEEIKDTDFAIALRHCNLGAEDTLLFIFMAHLFVENNDDNIGFHDIDNIFDENEIPGWCKRELRSRKSGLFDQELIENVNEDGMARSDAFKLTDKAKNELLCELSLNSVGKSDKDLSKLALLQKKL